MRITLLFLYLLISGCASNSSPIAHITLRSSHYLNPSINGNPAPVVVSLYELNTPFRFRQASYQALTTNAVNALGNSLIDKQTVEIQPASQKRIKLTLSPDTHYLGFIAGYRRIDQANWKNIMKISSKKRSVTLNVTLDALTITTANQGGK